jgi:prepilin-type N-terminal cleavage/methylation domain-containing protein
MKHTCLVKSKNGFTLIEIIVGLVLAAIMGTMLVMVAGQNLARSTVPVTTLDDLLLLQEEMESINARYYSELSVIQSMDAFRTFLNEYNNPHFSVTVSDFDDGSGKNHDLLRVELTSKTQGATLVTLTADVNN